MDNTFEIDLIRKKALRYELLFEQSDDAILVIEDDQFVDCNQAVLEMLGYKSKNELLNTHPSELSPEWQPDGQRSYEKAERILEILKRKKSLHFEWTHLKANGLSFPVEVWLSSFEFNGKLLLNTIWRDLTEKKRKEAQLKAFVEEKDVLLTEIHHRVKNNLQIITSLMNLQSNLTDDENSKELFKQSKFRVKSIALIHEMLYQSKDISSVDYRDYLIRLVGGIITSFRGKHNNIDLEVNASVVLNMDTAIPLGLLINEIITNSLKHAFNEVLSPKLTIQIASSSKGLYEMNIGDNGIGMTDIDKLNNPTSLGLQLVESLVTQLKGTIELAERKKGTTYIIHFQEI